MKIRKNLFSFFIFSSILILSIINIKNPEKIKFYLFTSKVEEITLGNLITLTFISGFTFSSILNLISTNYSKESLVDNFKNDEEIDISDENNFSQELEYDRPPERDIRDSQPTISVNYRFVDQDKNSYNSKKINNNLMNEDNDWVNYENEW